MSLVRNILYLTISLHHVQLVFKIQYSYENETLHDYPLDLNLYKPPQTNPNSLTTATTKILSNGAHFLGCCFSHGMANCFALFLQK